MPPEQFFPWLKQESEKFWKTIELKDNIYGFQIQAGTKWNDGLTDDEIARFENDMGFTFPEIYKLYLRTMNGTDKETINIYARCGEPVRYSPGYFSYSRDLEAIRDKIAWILEKNDVTSENVEEMEIPHILPLLFHRFLIIDRCLSNPVLSMYGNDIIPYASSLMTFLVNDIFRDSAPDPEIPDDLIVDFWLK